MITDTYLQNFICIMRAKPVTRIVVNGFVVMFENALKKASSGIFIMKF